MVGSSSLSERVVDRDLECKQSPQGFPVLTCGSLT